MPAANRVLGHGTAQLQHAVLGVRGPQSDDQTPAPLLTKCVGRVPGGWIEPAMMWMDARLWWRLPVVVVSVSVKLSKQVLGAHMQRTAMSRIAS